MPEEFIEESQFLISVDHAADIFIDTKEVGSIKLNEFLTFKVFPGEHYLEAISLDKAWSWKGKVFVESGSQRIVEIKMLPSDQTVGILGEFKDLRDNNKYLTVTIKNVTWMAENLRYKSVNSFDLNNDPSNAQTFGKYYLFDNAASVCPNGWHLPSKQEWEDLAKLYLPQVSIALRPGGKSNFNLTFGGYCIHDLDTLFKQANSSCNYWTNTPKKYIGGQMKEYVAETMFIDTTEYKIAPFSCNIYNKPWGHFANIRCIKND